MPNNVFYPSLSEILPIDNIPASLGPIKNGVQNLFQHLYYKDLQVEKSAAGDAAFYKLKLLAYQRIGFEIPGTGASIILNPDDSGLSITEIPISLGYKLEILKHVKDFQQNGFASDPSAYFNLFLDIIDVEPGELLQEVINVFISDPSPVQKFVTDFNAKYSAAIAITTNPNIDVFEDLITQIEGLNMDFAVVAFTDFINTLNSFDEIFENIKALFKKWLGDINLDDIKRMFVPQVDLSVDNVAVGLEFPTSLFRRVDDNPISPSYLQPLIDPMSSGDVSSVLKVNLGSIGWNSDDGFRFGTQLSASFPLSEIMRTGFCLKLNGVKLDFSRTSNIPEATADGRPDDFIGAYITDAEILFPISWNHDGNASTGELFASNLLVGTGGVSGTIGLKAMNANDPAPFIKVRFGEKFEVELDSFSITFQQNAIIASEILGKLTIPGMKDAGGGPCIVDIKIHIDGNGDFYITAKEENGITLPLHFEQYFTVTVNSLTIGKRSGKFYLATSGKVDFNDQLANGNSFIGDLLPKDIEIQKLLIWENGQIELEGGTVTLRKPVKINIGPVKLTVTALGMGSYERQHGGQLRKYKYVEFSAGVSINPGGVDARGDGIKVYFTIDNDSSQGRSVDVFVRIQSIAIDLIIPGNASKEQATLLLSGYLSMKEPTNPNSDAGTEYAGGIDFVLPKLKMGGSAAMRYNPKVPSFLIDVSLEISTPIVLGSTGMGIYGFRALFGKQYIVSKTEAPVSLSADAEWWQYYKKKVNPELKEGVTASKMANLPGFSFGAGISLATATDGGKAFSSKLFFLLSLPDVFLLQGQAKILGNRIGLDDTTDPPFFALLAIDKTSISSALGVNYKIPDDGADVGKVATIDAIIDMAYFWHDSSAWYLNIGKDQPVDRRVRARIFDLFDVYSYFMLSASGIRAGAGASLEKNYKVGPIKAHLYAYMDTAGRISFKPKQIGGSIDIGGGVDIKVLGKGFSLTASASLAAEAPKPFIVTGSVEVCVKVLKKEYCIDLDFTWTFNQTLDFSEIPVVTSNLISQGGGPSVNNGLQDAMKSLNVMSQETLNVLCIDNISTAGTSSASIPLLSNSVWNTIDTRIIPIDSYIDIEFRKPMKPVGDASLARFGGVNTGFSYTDYVAPQRGKSNRVRHDYVLDKVEIFSWNPTGNSWDPYHVYNAITPLNLAPFLLTSTDLNNLQFGSWQIDNPGKYTKLRIMAQNPMTFLAQGSGDTTPEDMGITNAIFCPPDAKDRICINLDDVNLQPGKTINIPGDEITQHKQLLVRFVSNDATVVYKPMNGINTAVSFLGSDTMEIYLPEPMAEVSMLLTTLTAGLTINYYKRVQTGVDASNIPVYGYSLVLTEVKTPAQLALGTLYSNGNTPIDKIEITGGACSFIPGTSIVCDSTVSGQAQDLLSLLNLICKFRELTQDIKLLGGKYDTLVRSLSIFPHPIPDPLLYHPSVNGNSLNITFSGPGGYNCQVIFSAPNLPFAIDWKNISKFVNIRPDPSHPSINGTNFFFLVDIVLNNGTVITLQGVSKCIPIYSCYDKCLNFFYQLCYLNVVDYMYNQNLPTGADVSNNNSNMADAINKTLVPVWRPDTTFAIRVQYTDQVFEESSSHTNNSRAFVLGFRTKGPIGHFHEYPTGNTTTVKQTDYASLEADDKEDQYKLATLQHYIDLAKSYPNADGNIVNAKPLYYQAPELLLFYIYPHVYQFYQNWASYNGAPKVDSSLEVLIKDPIEPPLVTNPLNPTGPLITNVAPPANNTWQINNFPHITPDIALLNNMVQNGMNLGNPCVPATVPFTPPGINNSVTPPAPLEPLKLYTAIYNAVYNPASLSLLAPVKREVHRYGFQTSRYKDFHEHINSYILQTNPQTLAIEKTAVYELKKAFSAATITRAQQVLNGTLPSSDALHAEAAIDYDKLVDRLLEFKELEPAEYLQFNLVIDTNTNNILGILLRSPEPFNDPKTPATPLNDCIQMEVDTGSGYGNPLDFITFYSKDKASVFITNKDFSMNVPRALHRFTFRYKLYNGNSYAIKTTEQVILDLNNII